MQPSMQDSHTGHSAASGAGANSTHTAGPLLVATTGRDGTAVFTAARLLAERLGSTPEVVAVAEPLALLLPGIPMEAVPPELYAEQRRRIRDDVTHALRSAFDGNPSWPVQVEEGQPARTIARLARERQARLIVMGIGRHAPVDRVLGTETALQTIRVADRPVFAVAPTFGGLPRHAVVAMDFSPASVRAASEALALLAEGGTLSLVYVRPSTEALRRLGDQAVNWIHGDGVTDRFERLLAALVVPRGVTVEPVTLEGDPAGQVLDFSERQGAELIATGSAGLGFFDRLIVGSVATRLLRRATTSVLMVPRPPAAEVARIEQKLANTTESTDPALWPAMLEQFTARNAARATQLEVDDPDLGAQLQQSGYTLLGVSYDRRDDRLAIMLGAPAGGTGHLTHTVGGVTSIAVLTGPQQRDLALQARHGRGQTILSIRD